MLWMVWIFIVGGFNSVVAIRYLYVDVSGHWVYLLAWVYGDVLCLFLWLLVVVLVGLDCLG